MNNTPELLVPEISSCKDKARDALVQERSSCKDNARDALVPERSSCKDNKLDALVPERSSCKDNTRMHWSQRDPSVIDDNPVDCHIAVIIIIYPYRMHCGYCFMATVHVGLQLLIV